ncbi:MAG: beta-ketoacyl-ACP synthase II [Anaerolineae bacterium]
MAKERSDAKRVVITGLGAITPLGLNVQKTWEGLLAGRSGIGPVTLFDASELPSRIAAEVKGFDPTRYMAPKQARRMARCSQFTIAAGWEAMVDAGLVDASQIGTEAGEVKPGWEDGERTGVLLGTAIGGFDEAEAGVLVIHNKGYAKLNPFVLSASLPNIPAHHLSYVFGAKGYISTVATACASGTQAIGEAAEIIRRGRAEVMITGGVEAMVCKSTMAGFIAMRALSTRNDEPERASRPFDKNRDGFVIGEGCGILILESLRHARARGARIYAELLGQASSSDAYHVAAPDPEGYGAVRAMRWALEDAGLTPAEVDYINAHATSTPLGDVAEVVAIKKLFRERAKRIPTSATKSMIGHSLGAAGAIEAIASILTIRDGIIHPTVNYETLDPDCDLDCVPNEARRAEVKVVLSNSFGFGGQNACLVIGRFVP